MSEGAGPLRLYREGNTPPYSYYLMDRSPQPITVSLIPVLMYVPAGGKIVADTGCHFDANAFDMAELKSPEEILEAIVDIARMSSGYVNKKLDEYAGTLEKNASQMRPLSSKGIIP
jgi:hypothetical protein